MNKNKILKLNNLIKNISEAVIVAHYNPDGDAVGSALGLSRYLDKLGVNTHIVFPSPYPDFLKWLFKNEKVLIYNNKTKKNINNLILNTEAVFCVDFNAFHRTNDLEKTLSDSAAYKVLIDHHINPDVDAFDLIFSDVNTSATASLIFDIIVESGQKSLIDKPMAEAIYVGMATDTGSFSYNANYIHTYEILVHLFSLGIDGAHIQRLVYNNFTENRMRLFGLCLNQNLHVYEEFKTAYIVLSKNDLKKYSYQIGDTEGIVNYALAIKNIDCALLFIERDGYVRISLRSYGNLNVNKIAANVFEGGGHKNAAGANSYLNLNDTIGKFKSILPDLDKFRD